MDAEAWRGAVGDVWAAEWALTDRSFAGLTPHLDAAIRAAAPGAGATVMDVGCGAGATSLALAAARADLRVVGTDLSETLVAVARERASGQPNLSFRTGDSSALAAVLKPDMLISRHGVMFFADPAAAFGALAAAVPHGGRFVFSCFAARADNLWAVEPVAAIGGADAPPPPMAPGPFAFADPAPVAALLAASGWEAPAPARIDFAYVAGAGDDPVDHAVRFFTRIGPAAARLNALPPADRPAARAALAAVCERHRAGETVAFPAAAWIWSATRSEGTAS